MNRSTGIGIAVVVAVVFGIFMLVYMLKPQYNWGDNYRPDNKHPYGTYIAAELLKSYFPGEGFEHLDKKWDSTMFAADSVGGSNYVFIGTNCYLDSGSADQLLNFVSKGNNAMIIANSMPIDLLNVLGITDCVIAADTETYDEDTEEEGSIYDSKPDDYRGDEYERDTTIDYADDDYYKTDTTETYTEEYADDEYETAPVDTIAYLSEDEAEWLDTTATTGSEEETPSSHTDNGSYSPYGYGLYYDPVEARIVRLDFEHPALKDDNGGYEYAYVNDFDTLTNTWEYIKPENPCMKLNFPFTTLGKMSGTKINFIRVKYGKGTIYFHTTPRAFTNFYLLDERHLDYVEKVFSHLPQGKIYWDEYHRIWREGNSDGRRHGGGPSETPLRFILSQPSLRWGWFLIIAMVIVYTIFHIKRRQRIIPVLEKNVNTSLEFVQTVGSLYFQQNDHKQLAAQKMRLLMAYIRNRYHINTSLDDDELAERIATKAGIELQAVRVIFSEFRKIERLPNIDDLTLISFHHLIENFYQKCK